MIPRIRPFFHPSYIDAALDDSRGREELAAGIGRRLLRHHRGAREMEFLDYGNNSLLASFSVLGLRRGDAIALPAFTCPTILGPVLRHGLRPVLIDVDDDMRMFPDQMRERVDVNVRALLVSHVFGIPMNLPEARELADERGIPLIEDCAHCACSTVRGMRLGTYGDVSFTSHRVDKPLAVGKGSVLVLNNGEYGERFREVVDRYPLNGEEDERMAFLNLVMYFLATERERYSRFLGMEEYYERFRRHPVEASDAWERLGDFPEVGMPRVRTRLHPWYHFIRGKFMGEELSYDRTPLRMNSLLLRVFDSALEFVGEMERERRRVSADYHGLMDEGGKAVVPSGAGDVPLLRFPIICHDTHDHRRLKRALVDNGVEAGIFNWSPSMGEALGRRGDCPSADHIASNILNLPSHPYVSGDDVASIVETIRGVCR